MMMRMNERSGFLVGWMGLSLLCACSAQAPEADAGPTYPDAGTVAADASSPAQDAGEGGADATVLAVDGGACDPSAWPVPATMAEVRREEDEAYPLTLDGSGTRCEQLTRALLDPAQRPQDLEGVDPTGAVGSCELDPVRQNDVVRLHLQQVAGLPHVGSAGGFIAHVTQQNSVVWLNGQYVRALSVPQNAFPCLDDAGIVEAVVGSTLSFTVYESCSVTRQGSYVVASSDVIEPRALGGVFVWGSGLHLARAVEFSVASANATADTRSSELSCGLTLFVDAIAGEILGWSAPSSIC